MRKILAIVSLCFFAAASAYADSCPDKFEQLQATAKSAGLHYSSPDGPGMTRELVDGAFVYHGPSGKRIEDEATLERIRKIGIPKAYDHVWIASDPESHIQATAFGSDGKKQYYYHAAWNEARDLVKFNRVREFGSALPQVRERVEKDLSIDGMPRQKILATLVRFLDASFIRIGNEEYAAKNETYGLTTFLKSHVTSLEGDTVTLNFVGKASKEHEIPITDPKLAKIVSDLQKIPGDRLFQYRDTSGAAHPLDSTDVNKYIKEVSGGQFTAKDFRTWGGTISATKSLIEAGPPASTSAATQAVNHAVEFASSRLGNTPKVCREKYIHPVVLHAYAENTDLFFKAVTLAREAIARGKSTLKLEEQTALTLIDLAKD